MPVFELDGTEGWREICPFPVFGQNANLKLTPAEIQVTNLVRQGKTTKEIADGPKFKKKFTKGKILTSLF